MMLTRPFQLSLSDMSADTDFKNCIIFDDKEDKCNTNFGTNFVDKVSIKTRKSRAFIVNLIQTYVNFSNVNLV